MGGSSEKETPAPRDRDFDKEGLRNLEKLGGGAQTEGQAWGAGEGELEVQFQSFRDRRPLVRGWRAPKRGQQGRRQKPGQGWSEI